MRQNELVTEIYILNRKKEVIDVLSNNGSNPVSPFFDDTYKAYLNGGESFEFTTLLNERTNDSIQKGGFCLFKYLDKTKLFQIMSIETIQSKYTTKKCYCEIVGLELFNKAVRKANLNCDVKAFFNFVLQDSNFELGYVDPDIVEFKTVEIESPIPIYTAIQNNLETFNIEIEFTVELRKNKVYKQYINVYKKRGNITHARFEYSNNMSEVRRKEDLTNFCSALIGIGSNKIDFKEVEWLVANGNPTDKPLNQDFVADESARAYFHNEDGSHIIGVFETQIDNAADLLNETWNELQKRKEPQIEYETNIIFINADEINVGDTVYVIDNEFPTPLHLEARISELEISFTDYYEKSKCKLSNHKDVKSNIKVISFDSTLKEIIDFLGGIGIGDLTDEEIAKIKDFMERMGIDKDEIDKLFQDIENVVNPEPIPPSEDEEENEAVYLTSIKNGVWLGDDRFFDLKNSSVANITSQNEYKKALELYTSFNIATNQNATSLNNIMSTGNQYKIYAIVNYYCRLFGLDPSLVYAIIIGESNGDPYCATTYAGGGYGIMQCERAAYFKEFSGTKSITIKYLNGNTKEFWPCMENMTPGIGGTAVVNGITVDRNILNQIRFGCWQLRTAIDYCHNNIFAALVMYNMGVGSLNWIISRYICETYGYIFVDSYSLSSQCNEVKVKFYEILESGTFDFASYRQIFSAEKGLGTVNNVELYLQYYKIIDGQLPYVLDANGNKIGLGVTTTPKAQGKLSSSQVRQKIVDTAKAIAQQHTDKLATYDQTYRTVNFQKPNRYPGTFYGLKNPICYDCSSVVSCCYLEAGLKSVYNANCTYGTLVANATKKEGYVMFKITQQTIENMIPGDIIMMCNNECPSTFTRSMAIKVKFTHHTLIYCGKENGVHMVAHARKWDYWPKAIRYMAVYSDIYKYGFCLRPYDLIESDNNSNETTIVEESDLKEFYIKALRKAKSTDFIDENNRLKSNVIGVYGDDDKVYPSTSPYAILHFGINDLTQNLIGIKNLSSLLKERYRNTPIFILKELHVGATYENYETVNSQIDVFNSELETFCNNEENIFLIDISQEVETYTGLLNPDFSTDGYRFKDDASIQVFYDAIVEKILATPIRYKKLVIDDNNSKDETIQGVKVSVVLTENGKHEYDVVNDMTFLLPSDVVANFYSRLIFTTAKDTEPTKYTQSKIVYLEGDDCVAGQLIPKADTKYRILVMTNTNTEIDYKYYGSVTAQYGQGQYKQFDKFIGGDKVVELAKTFLDKGLEYAGSYSTTALKTPASFKNPAANLSQWYDSVRNKNQIDCSTFIWYIFRGCAYNDTPYYDHSMTANKVISKYSWIVEFPRNAAQQAEFCVRNGWVLHGADLVNFSNLQKGDLLFYDRDNQDNGRFMNISHVAMVYGYVNDILYTIEVTWVINASAVYMRPISDNHPTKILFVARVRKE